MSEGTGSARLPIGLIGGAAEDDAVWADVIELLDDRARILPLPGHGLSPRLALESVEEMAEAVAVTLGTPTVLVGHSMGGAVALTAALRHPERVAGVVAVSAGARLPVSAELLDPLPDIEAVLPRIIALSTGGRDSVPEGREFTAERMARMLRRGGGDLLQVDLLACADYDVRAELDQLACEVLVLVGTEDRMTSLRLAEELAAGAPKGRLHVIEGAGHQVPWDAPGAVVEAVEHLAGGLGDV